MDGHPACQAVQKSDQYKHGSEGCDQRVHMETRDHEAVAKTDQTADDHPGHKACPEIKPQIAKEVGRQHGGSAGNVPHGQIQTTGRNNNGLTKGYKRDDARLYENIIEISQAEKPGSKDGDDGVKETKYDEDAVANDGSVSFWGARLDLPAVSNVGRRCARIGLAQFSPSLQMRWRPI